MICSKLDNGSVNLYIDQRPGVDYVQFSLTRNIRDVYFIKKTRTVIVNLKSHQSLEITVESERQGEALHARISQIMNKPYDTDSFPRHVPKTITKPDPQNAYLTASDMPSGISIARSTVSSMVPTKRKEPLVVVGSGPVHKDKKNRSSEDAKYRTLSSSLSNTVARPSSAAVTAPSSAPSTMSSRLPSLVPSKREIPRDTGNQDAHKKSRTSPSRTQLHPTTPTRGVLTSVREKTKKYGRVRVRSSRSSLPNRSLANSFIPISQNQGLEFSEEIVSDNVIKTRNGSLGDEDDAREFLNDTLNQIRQEFREQHIESACPLSRLFECRVDHTLVCAECGHQNIFKEHYQDFRLDVPTFEKPRESQSAHVHRSISKLPDILVIQLKRFTPQPTRGYNKNRNQVMIDATLDFCKTACPLGHNNPFSLFSSSTEDGFTDGLDGPGLSSNPFASDDYEASFDTTLNQSRSFYEPPSEDEQYLWAMEESLKASQAQSQESSLDRNSLQDSGHGGSEEEGTFSQPLVVPQDSPTGKRCPEKAYEPADEHPSEEEQYQWAMKESLRASQVLSHESHSEENNRQDEDQTTSNEKESHEQRCESDSTSTGDHSTAKLNDQTATSYEDDKAKGDSEVVEDDGTKEDDEKEDDFRSKDDEKEDDFRSKDDVTKEDDRKEDDVRSKDDGTKEVDKKEEDIRSKDGTKKDDENEEDIRSKDDGIKREEEDSKNDDRSKNDELKEDRVTKDDGYDNDDVKDSASPDKSLNIKQECDSDQDQDTLDDDDDPDLKAAILASLMPDKDHIPDEKELQEREDRELEEAIKRSLIEMEENKENISPESPESKKGKKGSKEGKMRVAMSRTSSQMSTTSTIACSQPVVSISARSYSQPVTSTSTRSHSHVRSCSQPVFSSSKSSCQSGTSTSIRSSPSKSNESTGTTSSAAGTFTGPSSSSAAQSSTNTSTRSRSLSTAALESSETRRPRHVRSHTVDMARESKSSSESRQIYQPPLQPEPTSLGKKISSHDGETSELDLEESYPSKDSELRRRSKGKEKAPQHTWVDSLGDTKGLFQLQAAVSHTGLASSTTEGHYICDYLGADGIWRCFDGGKTIKVGSIADLSQRRSRSGYLFFYVRCHSVRASQ
ncbi:hypothetical protein BGX31_003692 [Mortierella sp. GBA43]|nr:hypothetical protein BGX31_003692 [Mortierella sp. GBA43]